MDKRARSHTVVLLGTFDTKGLEYAYFADRVRERGADVLLVDVGIQGSPLTAPDVTREDVASAAGADVAALAAAGDRGAAVGTMARGAAEVVARLDPVCLHLRDDRHVAQLDSRGLVVVVDDHRVERLTFAPLQHHGLGEVDHGALDS